MDIRGKHIMAGCRQRFMAASAVIVACSMLTRLSCEGAATGFSYDAAGNRIAVASLSGTAAPTIIAQPITQISGTGYQISFSVIATGSPTLAYQWLFNNVAIAGGTKSTFFLPSVSSTNFGNYSVKVSNSVSTVTSGTAQLLLDSDN